ncbi:probable F-actin-capping protein subunit beta [Tanacetum coccineum]
MLRQTEGSAAVCLYYALESPWSNKFHPHLEDGMYPSEELRKLEVEAKGYGSKYAHGKRGYLHEGGWEAIHVIQVGPDEEGMAHYCLTSTIMLSLTTDSDTSGTFNLSGSIRRQVYFGKTKEMVCTLRPPSELLSMTLPDSRNP